MSLLEVENVKFKYTDKDLYNNVSFRILNNEHIVLVGPNGSGKSTFMNIIAKNIIPDSGDIMWQPNVKYAYLDQHLKIKQDVSINDYIYGVFKELFTKEKEMENYFSMLGTCRENEYEKILNRAMIIQEELEKNNFYAINSTIGNVLNGLGISNYDLDVKLKNLSGGQRAKVYLAKLLLEAPDVLLMDEPTNFLDSEHVEWLIKFLNSFSGSFVVISHDEYFIKNIANVIYALHNKTMVRYKGNYDFYLKESEIRNEHFQREYENQQKFIKQTQDFIDRNIVRATTSKAAKSRVKVLEKLDKLEKPVGDLVIKIKFPYSKDLGTEVLKFNNLEIGYNKSLLPPLNYVIKKNEKIAILGKNGVGKSTIIKTITDQIPPIAGSFSFGNSVTINYFSQEYEYLDETPIAFIRGFYPLKTDGEIRSILAPLGIKGDLALKSMKQLSGGEQTRVRLALMTMKKSNVLIFDEPTNHLDINTKEALFEAIDNFPGSIILVSHEKDFYDELVDYEITY